MKKLVMCMIAAVLLAWAFPAFACTGFAVYGEQSVYGMNFDYPETEVRLSITQDRDLKYFSMQFQENGRFQPTVGMNDKGLFASMQMQLPSLPGESGRSPDELYVHELFGCIGEYGSVEDVRTLLDDKRLIHWSGVTLHTLLADPTGDALIAEAGEERNEIISIEDNFIVMTNYKNSDFRGQPYDKVYGAGAERYITAYEYIEGNMEGFGIDQAFEILRLTAQEGRYPTLCSMVFVPGEQSVYVVLHRDFGEIWKISIPDETIETYCGFENTVKFDIPRDGVLASDLMDGNYAIYDAYAEKKKADTDNADRSLPDGYLLAALVVLAVAVILTIGILVRKRRRAS